MARRTARRAPTVRNTAAHGKQLRGGLELPDDWLAWKPFGYARQVYPRGLYSRGPAAKVVESEEDLHIFGLAAAVNEAVPAAQEPATRRGDYRPGRPKVSKLRAGTAFAPHQHPPIHPPHRHGCNEFGGTGRDGGGWGMAAGQESGAAGYEQRRSMATPRAFAMNVDVNADQAGFEQGGRPQYPGGSLPPQAPPTTQQQPQPQQPHPSQYWGTLNGGACHGFPQDEGQGQVQGYGGWQQDHHQQQQQQQQQQPQYGVPPSSHVFPHMCPPAPPVRPLPFLPPQMPPQYPPYAQPPMPKRSHMNPYHGQCYGCCRGPCQCEHIY